MSRIWSARGGKENGRSIGKGQSASPEAPPPDQLVDTQSLRTSYPTGAPGKIGVLNSNGMGCMSPVYGTPGPDGWGLAAPEPYPRRGRTWLVFCSKTGGCASPHGLL